MPNSKAPAFSRRRVLTALTAVPGLSLLAKPALAAIATPNATEGPFYPTPAMRFADIDNDLIRIAGTVRRAGGEIVRLSGTVRDSSGNPIEDARVEIWQCDVNGRYIHTSDTNATQDTAFQGFGHDITGSDGRYSFRTIKPVAYPGRTPHIHVKVFSGDTELTTQFYIKGDPQNRRDSLFKRMSAAEQQSVEMAFDTQAEPQATVDITL